MGSRVGGGPSTALRVHTALENSIAANFAGNHAINCMCHSTENIYRWRDTAVARASGEWATAWLCGRAQLLAGALFAPWVRLSLRSLLRLPAPSPPACPPAPPCRRLLPNRPRLPHPPPRRLRLQRPLPLPAGPARCSPQRAAHRCLGAELFTSCLGSGRSPASSSCLLIMPPYHAPTPHFTPPPAADWDMFSSRHVAADIHATARAVSGSPVYVSDAPGSHR